jgi:hypothetical protein
MIGETAGVLGHPINLGTLGALWPDGAPSWLPAPGPSHLPALPEGLVRFDNPQSGRVLMNPRLVALVRPIGPGVTEVVLNLSGGTEKVVLHLCAERVQAGFDKSIR